MKILMIDNKIFEDDNELTNTSFFTTELCGDYDVVIWNMTSSNKAITDEGTATDGGYQLRSNLFNSLKDFAIERRRADFNDYLSNGGILLVLTARTPVYYNNIDRVTPISLRDAIGANYSISIGSGQVVETIVKDDAIAKNVLDYKPCDIKYSAIIDSHDGTTIATNKRGKAIAVRYNYPKNGALYLLPNKIEYPSSLSLKKSMKAILKTFDELRRKNSMPDLPNWAGQYRSGKEQETKECFDDSINKYQKAKLKMDQAEKEYNAELDLKRLFTGTGDEVEAGVNRLLKILGGDLSEDGVKNRVDHIAEFPNDLVIAVETKGLRGSATEDNATQLSKWVDEYFKKKKKTPKGLLVVNGWRETPLEDRKDPVFHSHIVEYADMKGYCLMTGVQAYNIIQAVRKEAAKANDVLKEIFSTKGIFQGYDDISEIMIKESG